MAKTKTYSRRERTERAKIKGVTKTYGSIKYPLITQLASVLSVCRKEP